jgi:FimV-like protein
MAGAMLEVAGHKTSYSHPECTLILWTLAYEVFGYAEPDWYMALLVANENWAAIAEAYERLLLYEPDRAEWQLALARAYFALNRSADAERILQPILALSSQALKEEAEALLGDQSRH